MPAAPLDAVRPPWREPLVWMVWGIPALTVVAGLFTWWIASSLQRLQTYASTAEDPSFKE